MRISDWSSDVCSSDLRGGQQRRKHAAKCWRFGSRSVEYASSCGAIAQLGERRVRNAEVEGSIPFRSTIRQARPGIVGASAILCGSTLRTPEAGDVASHRKSVVQGQSVSVRVDLGGRRIINKKITTSRNLHTQEQES